MTDNGGHRSTGDLRSDRIRPGLIAGGFSSPSLGLSLLAVVALGGFLISQGLQRDVAAKPTPSPEPTASQVASPASTSASSPAAPTAHPGTLVGVVPGPDATLPPNAPPVIPGLRVVDLASAAEAQGMTCQSEAGTYQEGSGGYTLACNGRDPGGHAKLGLAVTYWVLDGVSEIYFSVWSDPPGSMVSPATPIRLMSSIGSLSSGAVARTWVLAHLDDPGCRDTCTRTEGAVRLEVQSGENGSRALHVIATAG